MDLNNKGIRFDTTLIEAPHGSWAWAKNIVINSGYKEARNEDGFQKILERSNVGENIIGSIYTGDHIVLFMTNNTDSIIRRVDKYGTVIPIIDSAGDPHDELNTSVYNFDRLFEIHGCYKYLVNGNLIIAFTDGEDHPFLLNLDKLPFVLDVNGEIVASTNSTIAETATRGYLFSHLIYPAITATPERNTGGAIAEGAYAFGIAYELDDYELTIYSPVSNIVAIANSTVDSNLSQAYATLPKTFYSDSAAGDLVSQRIKLDIGETVATVDCRIDDRYSNAKLFTLAKIESTWQAFIIGDYPVDLLGTTGTLPTTIYYTGSYDEETSSSAVTIPTITFDKCKTITDVSNRLVAGNITYNDFGLELLQQEAIDYQAEFSYQAYGSVADNPRNSPTFPLDEVIALYIRWFAKDGSVSQWIHIPGRDVGTLSYVDYYVTSNSVLVTNTAPAYGAFSVMTVTSTGTATTGIHGDTDTNTLTKFSEQYGGIGGAIDGLYYKFASGGGQYAVQLINETGASTYTVSLVGDASGETAVTGYFLYTATPSENDVLSTWALANHDEWQSGLKIFHTRDTNSATQLGYWENANELYPNTDAFDGTRDLRGTKVLHHKTPSIAYLHSATDYVGGKLSINITNITIPTALQSTLVSYQIGYAYRDFNNSTVLGYSPLMANDWDIAPPIENNVIRTHDFTLLSKKPAVKVNYVKGLYRNTFTIGVACINNLPLHSWVNNILGLQNGVNDRYLAIESNEYIPYNSFGNEGREEYMKLIQDGDKFMYTAASLTLGSLHSINLDMYTSFTNQDIVIGSPIRKIYAPTSTMISLSNEYGDNFYSMATIGVTPDRIGIYPIMFPQFGVYNFDFRKATFHYGDSDVLGALLPEVIATVTCELQKYNRVANYEGYNTDLAALPSINTGAIYDSTLDDILVDQHQVRRSIIQGSDYLGLAWTNFLTEDIYTMPRNRGAIFALISSGKNLYIQHDKALYKAVSKDKMATNETEVYLGTGDIFDREPDEIIPIEGGFIGCKSRFATKNTKVGYVVLDAYNGSIYLINNTLTELTSKENASYDYFKEWGNLFGYTDDCQAPTGIGFTLGYDDKIDSIIVTKRAVLFEDERVNLYTIPDIVANVKYKFTITDCSDSDVLVITTSAGSVLATYSIKSGDENIIYFTSSVNVKNPKIGDTSSFRVTMEHGLGSGTFSYHTKLKYWVAQHDYIPNIYTEIDGSLVSIVNNNDYAAQRTQVYKHHDIRKKAIYYDEDTPFTSYIDFIVNHPKELNKQLVSVMWDTYVKRYDGVTTYNETFNGIVIYNDSQCTELITLNSTNNWYDESSGRVIGRVWNFNDFQDAVLSNITRFINDNHNILSSNVNKNSRNWFDKSEFISNFIVIRLVYNNSITVVNSENKQNTIYVSDIIANFDKDYR